MAEKKMRFEDALKELEAVVEKLEAGHIGLEEALSCYEDGMKLVRFCHSKLNEAEKRIETVRLTEEGFVCEPFTGAEV